MSSEVKSTVKKPKDVLSGIKQRQAENVHIEEAGILPLKKKRISNVTNVVVDFQQRVMPVLSFVRLDSAGGVCINQCLWCRGNISVVTPQ